MFGKGDGYRVKPGMTEGKVVTPDSNDCHPGLDPGSMLGRLRPQLNRDVAGDQAHCQHAHHQGQRAVLAQEFDQALGRQSALLASARTAGSAGAARPAAIGIARTAAMPRLWGFGLVHLAHTRP